MAKKKVKMYENYHKKEPMTVYVNSELKQKIVDLAQEYGCSMTGMASMAIFTGIKKIQMNLEK